MINYTLDLILDLIENFNKNKSSNDLIFTKLSNKNLTLIDFIVDSKILENITIIKSNLPLIKILLIGYEFIKDISTYKYLESIEYFTSLLVIYEKIQSSNLLEKNLREFILLQICLYFNKSELILKHLKNKKSNLVASTNNFSIINNINFSNYDGLISNGLYKLLKKSSPSFLILNILISSLSKSKYAVEQAISYNIYEIALETTSFEMSANSDFAQYSFLFLQLVEKIAYCFSLNPKYFEDLLMSKEYYLTVFEFIEANILENNIGLYSSIVFTLFNSSKELFTNTIKFMDQFISNFFLIVEDYSFLNNYDYIACVNVLELILFLLRYSNLKYSLVSYNEKDDIVGNLGENYGNKIVRQESGDIIILEKEKIDKIFLTVFEFAERISENIILDRLDEYDFKSYW